MASSLMEYNNQLVKCQEELIAKREEIDKQIKFDEEERIKLQADIRLLCDRLAKVNESLSRKCTARAEFDKTIAEAEAAYQKILQRSHELADGLKKDTAALTSGGLKGKPAPSAQNDATHPQESGKQAAAAAPGRLGVGPTTTTTLRAGDLSDYSEGARSRSTSKRILSASSKQQN